MLVAHQRLQHSEIDSGFGKRRTEGVTESMRVPGWNRRPLPVVPEDGAQPGRRQWLTTMAPLGDHEELRRVGLRPLGQQVCLGASRDLRVNRRAPLFVAL